MKKKLILKHIIGITLSVTLSALMLSKMEPFIEKIQENEIEISSEGKVTSKNKSKTQIQIDEYTKIERNINRDKIDIAEAKSSLHNKYFIKSELTEEDILRYNVSAKAINQKILETNDKIRFYNNSIKSLINTKDFVESNLPSYIIEMNYVYLLGE